MRLHPVILYAWIVWCDLGLCSREVRADTGPDFDPPHSYIGNAGWNSELKLWIDIGDLPVGTEAGIPVRLRLMSAPSRGKALFDPLLWCPVLESTLSRLGDHDLEFTTLGGGIRFLQRADGGDFATLNAMPFGN